MVEDSNPDDVGGSGVVEEREDRGQKSRCLLPKTSDHKGSILEELSSKSSDDDDGEGSYPASLNTIIIFAIFFISVSGLFFLYMSFPDFEESEKPYLKLPTNLEDAKHLGDILSRYKDKYYYSVLGGIFVLYIFLQTFAIPGSIFLSILCGFLFPFFGALSLICFCSATGASLCYLISHKIGRKLVYYYIPERVEKWAENVKRHQDNLTNYIIFLRITPFLPNWFINIAAPIIDVPLFPFWLGTFIGVGPPSILAIHAGTTLQQLSSTNSVVSWQALLVLIGIGLLSLLPILFKSVLKSKFD